MKILFIGDVTGQSGVTYVREVLPTLIASHKPDLVIANGENAAINGRGITEQAVEHLYDSGVEFVTLGNHVWDQKETQQLLDGDERIIRPANMYPRAPGQGYVYCNVNGQQVAIVNVIGRTYMGLYDCPFRTMDEILQEAHKFTPFCVVDFHAEVTSEKLAMGYYLDGKVSAVIGTHTHVQTADDRVLPHGTAYLTDVGMTGPRNGILGVKKDLIIQRFITQRPVRFELDPGARQFNAVLLKLNDLGKAISTERIFIAE